VRNETRRLNQVAPAERAALYEKLGAEILPRWLGFLDRVLASNRDGTGFVVGDSMTAADVALWYLIELIRDNGWTRAVARHPRLEEFARRVEERPRIKAYRDSAQRYPVAPLPR
jgi:glutathione S-transferase